MRMAIVAMSILLAAPAAAETMSGIWRINGLVLFIRQDGQEITIRTAIKRNDTGLVRLKLEGTVVPRKDVDGNDVGGLYFSTAGSSFPILYKGKKCEARPSLRGGGHVLGDVPGRIFRTEDAMLSGAIVCAGEPVDMWHVDLSGTWR